MYNNYLHENCVFPPCKLEYNNILKLLFLSIFDPLVQNS